MIEEYSEPGKASKNTTLSKAASRYSPSTSLEKETLLKARLGSKHSSNSSRLNVTSIYLSQYL